MGASAPPLTISLFSVMNRLELLHTIQENADCLTLFDFYGLLAGNLPTNDPALLTAWDQFGEILLAHRKADLAAKGIQSRRPLPSYR